MLSKNGGEFVVFFLLIVGGDAFQIGNRVFVFADVVGLDIVLENALGGEIKLVCVSPDGKPLFDIGNGFEAFEQRIVGKIFFIVAVDDDMALIADGVSGMAFRNCFYADKNFLHGLN